MADNDYQLSAQEVAELEADNGVRMADLAEDMIRSFLDPDTPFRLTPSHLLHLQQAACHGIKKDAGRFRTVEVWLQGRKHVPPKAYLVENLVRELCDFVNDNWHELTAIQLAAYLMWRLNWIHPFSDGNGRTSRTISYIALSVKLGYELPGRPTIPSQIEQNRDPYFDALSEADDSTIDPADPQVGAMERLIKDLLSTQLLSVVAESDGTSLEDLVRRS